MVVKNHPTKIDNNIAAKESLERKTFSKLNISDHMDTTGNVCKRQILVDNGTGKKIADLDVDFMYLQLCATEPSVDFMEIVQNDVNPSMLPILIDCLVEVQQSPSNELTD